MKTKFKLLICIVIALTSCSPNTFYQLYKTQSNALEENKKGVKFENADVTIIYNFWGNYGTSSFLIYNKTDSNIFVDLTKSHLIINGIAKTYFQNRSFGESSSFSYGTDHSYSVTNLNSYSSLVGSATFARNYASLISQTKIVSQKSSSTIGSKSAYKQGASVSYKEKKVICLPPHSSKIINGFRLNSSLYRDCDLYRYPTNNKIDLFNSSSKKIISKKFNQDNTPLIIENIISYGFDEFDLLANNIIRNKLWVSEITNYPSTIFFETVTPEYCGEESQYSILHCLFEDPGSFYIQYSKEISPAFSH